MALVMKSVCHRIMAHFMMFCVLECQKLISQKKTTMLTEQAHRRANVWKQLFLPQVNII